MSSGELSSFMESLGISTDDVRTERTRATRASRRPRARYGEDQDRMMFKVDLAAKKAGKSM